MTQFAPELIACIREGRPPTADEVGTLARRILRDVLGPAGDGEPAEEQRSKAILSARVALTGSAAAPSATSRRRERTTSRRKASTLLALAI